MTKLTSSQVNELTDRLDYNISSLKGCTRSEKDNEYQRLVNLLSKIEKMGEIKCRSKKAVSNLYDFVAYSYKVATKQYTIFLA